MNIPKKDLIIYLFLFDLVIIACGATAYFMTGYFYLPRVIFWLDVDIDDYKRFPERVISNQSPQFDFKQLPADSPYQNFFDTVPIRLDTGSVEEQDFEEYLSAAGTTAFIIIKDDTILYEKYLNDYQRDSINTSFSVAKSFISGLIGCAIEDGYIRSIDDPITAYLPELLERDPRFAQITIRHLLTMSSGIKFVKEGKPWTDDALTYYSPDLRKTALSASITGARPGEVFHYNGYNALLLGMILERTTNRPVSQYMQEKIWSQIGAEYPASWSLDSKRSGFEKMGSGINARSIDFARFGRLYLNDGNWNGKQLIPASWVQESTGLSTITDPSSFYQYFWWVHTEYGNQYRFSAQGALGQYIYIIPENQMIFVRNGSQFGDVDWINLFESLAAQIILFESNP